MLTLSAIQLSPQLLIPIITAIIGFVGGITARVIHYWIQQRTRRRKLRKALRAEVCSMKDLNEEELPKLREQIQEQSQVAHTFVPTTVYDSHTDELGLLDDLEIESLVQYYNSAHIAQQQLQMIANGDGNTTVLVERTLNNLIGHRREVLKQLNRNLDSCLCEEHSEGDISKDNEQSNQAQNQ